MAKLHLHNLRKSYGSTPVLHGVEMEIEDGEFVVIVGPSGCGKSTLLRMVAGLEGVDDGEIVIGNESVNRLEPAQRNIAMVFQNYALYPHMTVRQNMSYGLKIAGMPPSLIANRIEEAADTLELRALLDRKPRQLSGGQRQRVAMGRAIVREPAVFLFDEPLSNLDAKLRVQMRLELELLHQRLRTTSLYVTHDQVEAMTLADRMMVLNAGRVEQIGRPDQVYDRPASLFVAAFIGSPAMNLLELQAGKEGPSGIGVLQDATLLPINLSIPAKLQGISVTLGIRPEHLQVCAQDVCMLAAEVRLVEYLGADSYAYCKIAGKEIVVRLPAQISPRPGECLPLTAKPEHLHWFDTTTGKRLAP